MAAFSSIALAVGAVASVGGTIASMSAQNRAAKAAEKRETLASQRERRQAIRQFQIQRAQQATVGQAAGASGSSAVLGGTSGLSSQLGSGLGFQSQMTGLSKDYARAMTSAANFGALAGIGGTVMGMARQSGATFGKMLTPNRPPQEPAKAGWWLGGTA
jgi:hypothetical protein